MAGKDVSNVNISNDTFPIQRFLGGPVRALLEKMLEDAKGPYRSSKVEYAQTMFRLMASGRWKDYVDERNDLTHLDSAVERTRMKLARKLEELADEGHSGSMVLASYCYFYGIGVERELQTARDWMELAEMQGIPHAGMMLEKIDKAIEAEDWSSPGIRPKPGNDNDSGNDKPAPKKKKKNPRPPGPH